MKLPNPFRTQSDPDKCDNAVDTKKNIIERLIARFRQLRFDDASTTVKKVTVWVADPVYISLLMNDPFVEQLKTEIENNLILALKESEIVVRMGKPAAKIQASPIQDECIWFSFTLAEKPASPAKPVARITIAGGRGSMKRKVYELDVEKRTLFHIGRGDAELAPCRPFRENQIVIDDTEKNKEILAMNMHVSASHADIVYEDGQFFLKATPYGCRPDGSKTAVIREKPEGTIVHEIRDSSSRFRLRSGDMIELGESVVLTFTIS